MTPFLRPRFLRLSQDWLGLRGRSMQRRGKLAGTPTVGRGKPHAYTRSMRVLRGAAAVLGVMVAIASVGLLSWSLWPLPRERSTTILGLETLVASVIELPSEAVLQQVGDGIQLTLDTPQRLRIGEPGTVRLSLIPQLTEGPTPEGGYSLVAVARLRGPGMIVSPSGARGEPLSPGLATVFEWQILALRPGGAAVTLALGARFVPAEGGEAIDVPVWARTFELQAMGLGSLSAANARWLALGGMVAGLALSGLFRKEWQVWLARRTRRTTHSAL